jgi:hypothetical protein
MLQWLHGSQRRSATRGIKKMKTSPASNHEQVTLRHGYWFYFTDGDTRITAFGSGVSGKEIVYVGDETVSSKRRFTMRSNHHFSHQGNKYEVEFVIRSLWTGALECILVKNGQILDRTTKAYLVGNSQAFKTMWQTALVMALVGGVVGYMVTKALLWR